MIWRNDLAPKWIGSDSLGLWWILTRPVLFGVLVFVVLWAFAGCANTFLTLNVYNYEGQLAEQEPNPEAKTTSRRGNMSNTVNIGVNAAPKTDLTDSLNPDIKVSPTGL